ncbi:MAG: tetratricopeptide repeat protein [Verrucomicrobia bacterium]|nr:tetratricopeptide repeat protein [Verrucomicrobiota bacterium]MBS0646640.1 tetratricopeptide repeat protein [Verrucomicrobiota bacterium]
MQDVKWMEVLGWGKEQLQELRFAAFTMLRQGHYKKAAIYFEGLILLKQDYAYDQQTLGALYLQMGLNAEALARLDQALHLEPNHAPTLMNKAKALLMLGQRQEALKLAASLQKSSNLFIADDATALILAYS